MAQVERALADMHAHLYALRRQIDAGEAEYAWQALQTFPIADSDGSPASSHLRVTKAHCAARLAESARRSGACLEAVAWRRRALELDPQSPDRSIGLANAFTDAGDPQGAWALLTGLDTSKLSPKLAERFRKAMGQCALKMAALANTRQARDEAFKWFEQAIAFVPESPGAQLNWGWALIQRGRYFDAWQAMVRASELARDNPELTERTEHGLACSARALASQFEAWGEPPSVEGVDWRSAAKWREESLRHDLHDAITWRRYVWDLIYCGRLAEAGAAMTVVPSPDIAADLAEQIGHMPAVLKRQIEAETSIFRAEAPRYRARALPVVPARGKVVIPRQWEIFSDRMPSEDDYRRWESIPGANIGLVLGRLSGVFVVDIDTDEPEILSIFAAHLPPSPWRRIGRKGVALAYRWTGQTTQSFTEKNAPLVDFLGDPSHVVLPPSLHPQTGQPYRANCDLLDVLDDLPALPDDFAETVIATLRAAGRDVRLRVRPPPNARYDMRAQRACAL